MSIIEFNHELENWAGRNGISNVYCAPAIDFEYGVDEKAAYYSLFETEDDEKDNAYFLQFLYEYGLEGEYPEWVLSLLHEFGHHMTIHYFGEEVLDQYVDRKAALLKMESGYARSCEYWLTDVEFAANMWLIDFVKTHAEAVEELRVLCQNYFMELDEDELDEIYEALTTPEWFLEMQMK